MIPGKKTAICIFFSCLVFLTGLTGTLQARSYEYKVEGEVLVIKSTYLYMNGERFLLAPNVRFTLDTDWGRQIPRKEILNIGKIDRARLHIRDGNVISITVLRMDQ